MGRNRKTFTETFKKEVAIEALKERMPVNEIAAKYGISPSMVSNWKKDFISGGFSKEIQEMKKENESNKEKIDELYKELGKAKMENELLKKKWNL
ncbi:MAG: transposase [Spirochaetia bacterium]|nr:transposase [Spirochaetia bacterium]